MDEVARARGGARAYVVWLPVLDGDDRAAAEAACAKLGREVACYWDGGARLGRALGERLGLRARDGERPLAWDVYLVYPPGARWSNGAPPRPARWLQQLRAAEGLAPPLDGEALRAAIEQLAKAPR